MKEITITPPEGYEVDEKSSTFLQIVFKPIEKKNLSWEEIQKKNAGKTQFYLNTTGGVQKYQMHVNSDPELTITHVPTEHIAEKVRALCRLYIIAEYYNDGWVADWNNNNQVKCQPIWNNEHEIISYSILFSSSIATPVFKSGYTLLAAYEANREIFETALKP